MASSGPSIIIGIDFGTTYSGVAWARSGNKERIHTISDWSSQNEISFIKQKVPSAIHYSSNGSIKWGYDVTTDHQALRWFKLLLLDNHDIPAHIRGSKYIKTAKALLKKENKHVTEVIADYLRELWKHSVDGIVSAVGGRLVFLSTFKLVVTLPAMWPAYAQMRMHQAIQMAGLLAPRPAGQTTISFIPEPEAAALATLDEIENRPEMKKNDHFVVCDAGGGTVDIISYKIAKAKPMIVRESVLGEGKLSGAVRLDDKFAVLLKHKLPYLTEADISFIMNRSWENGIKPGFTNSNKLWTVEVPYFHSLSKMNNPNSITMTGDDIWQVFEDVLAENADLVMTQIRSVHRLHKKYPKFVILVGGFGRSRMLRQYLQQVINEEAPGVTILQDNDIDPWTAVCRGAVLKALAKAYPTSTEASRVDSRCARRSIGTLVNEQPFEDGVHDPRDKEWCLAAEEFQAADQVHWFVYKGDVIQDNEPITSTYFQDLKSSFDEMVTELVYSTADSPPQRCTSEVKQLCRVKWSHVPDFDSLPMVINMCGKVYRKVEYEIRMVTQGVSVDCQVYYKNKIVATKHIDVDFEESGQTIRDDCSVDGF